MANITLDPITRIEGHLAVELQTNGTNAVTGALSQGKMFRGFELILKNRNPRDAVILTQRICGV
jgi:Ni,Fe-hydrogenase I large subunit